ncbi:pyridoxal-phosphate dependent enzyme, partial [Roseomonas sp. DSM 102946]|nr:pyridoxal-phosphate dependent enzyme [Roseomonas sp. DSM 102946]
ELLRAGQIARMPRLFAVQPANCAPIARAALGAPPAEPRPTIAEGTAIAAPIRLPEVVQALRETHGGAVILEEEEIARATLELAGRGLYAEPTSAQAAAGFGRLLREGRIGAAQSTVLLLTGTGVKATPRIAELLGLTV